VGSLAEVPSPATGRDNHADGAMPTRPRTPRLLAEFALEEVRYDGFGRRVEPDSRVISTREGLA